MAYLRSRVFIGSLSQIDQEISREGWHYQQRGRESSKTDRYGKKYAWIAYFELAGYRQDLGLFERGGERIPDVDIDPSFPERPKSSQVFQSQWITGQGSVRDWLYSNFIPPVAGQLIVLELEGASGPWVLLHGFVERSSEDKSIFSFFDGILVQKQHTKKLLELLTAMEYPGNHAIPRPESEYYTFAGEVPWADTWRHQQDPQTVGSGPDEIPVVIPIRDYAWESYHSNENQSGGAPFLTKEVGEDLQLYVRIPSTRTAEQGSSSPATITVRSGESYKDSESILFIRKDLLDRYTAKHGMDLVLFVWGERRANYQAPGGSRRGASARGRFSHRRCPTSPRFYLQYRRLSEAFLTLRNVGHLVRARNAEHGGQVAKSRLTYFAIDVGEEKRYSPIAPKGVNREDH